MGPIVLEGLDCHDLPAVQALLEACREQIALALGRPASPDAARALYVHLPPGADRSAKHLLGISDPATCELLGLIDAVAHYPDASTLTVRLFLISPLYGDGPVPSEAQRLLEAWAAGRGMQRARIEVSATSWATLHFWQTAGFVAESAPVRDGRRLVVVFEKWLGQGYEGDCPSAMWTIQV
jgi:hypothetical protein